MTVLENIYIKLVGYCFARGKHWHKTIFNNREYPRWHKSQIYIKCGLKEAIEQLEFYYKTAIDYQDKLKDPDSYFLPDDFNGSMQFIPTKPEKIEEILKKCRMHLENIKKKTSA
jgi:hypothetical protein